MRCREEAAPLRLATNSASDAAAKLVTTSAPGATTSLAVARSGVSSGTEITLYRGAP